MTANQDALSYPGHTDSTELCPFRSPITKDATADVLQLPQAVVHGCCVSLQGVGGGAELAPLCTMLRCSHQAKVLIAVHISKKQNGFNTIIQHEMMKT